MFRHKIQRIEIGVVGKDCQHTICGDDFRCITAYIVEGQTFPGNPGIYKFMNRDYLFSDKIFFVKLISILFILCDFDDIL